MPDPMPEARRQPKVVGVGVRRATSEQWAATTLVMLQGEVGRDTTTGVVKFGDGVHTWAQLPVAAGAGQQVTVPAPDQGDDWPDLTILAEAAMQ